MGHSVFCHHHQVTDTRVDKGKDHWHELHVFGEDLLTHHKVEDKMPEKTHVQEFKPIHTQYGVCEWTFC